MQHILCADFIGTLPDWLMFLATTGAIGLSFCAFIISRRQDRKSRAEWENVRRSQGPRFRASKLSDRASIDRTTPDSSKYEGAIILARNNRIRTTDEVVDEIFGIAEDSKPVYILVQNLNSDVGLIDWRATDAMSGQQITFNNLDAPFFLLLYDRNWGDRITVEIQFETSKGFNDTQTYEVCVFRKESRLSNATFQRVDPTGVDHSGAKKKWSILDEF